MDSGGRCAHRLGLTSHAGACPVSLGDLGRGRGSDLRRTGPGHRSRYRAQYRDDRARRHFRTPPRECNRSSRSRVGRDPGRPPRGSHPLHARGRRGLSRPPHVVSLAPERAAGAGWPDGLLLAATLLAFLSLVAVAAVGILLWREIRSLQRPGDRPGSRYRPAAGPGDRHAGRGRARLRARSRKRPPPSAWATCRSSGSGSAPGAGRGATDASAVGSAGDTPGAIIVVQRGRGDLYRAVERGVAGPGLAVIWDRRRNERRRGARRPDGARAPPSRAPRLALRDVDAARVSAGVDQRRPESARAARPARRGRRARHAPLTRPGRPARARPLNRQPRGLPVGQSAASAPIPAIAAAVPHVAV